MCTRPVYITVEPTPYEKIQGFVTPYQIPVPCGKCFECLCRRQNSFMYRAYREAKQYGNMYHLTLSYSEDTVPMAKSLWRVSRNTGELDRHYRPEPIHKMLTPVAEHRIIRYDRRYKHKLVRARDKVFVDYIWCAPSLLRDRVISAPANGIPSLQSQKLEDYGFSEGFDFQYFETRSYDSLDFQQFLKYCKTEFGRKNFPVENLRYMVSPEYGERNTRRPHMHCLLINCPHEFAIFLQHAWKNGIIKRFKNGSTKRYFGYGRATLQHVNLYSKKYKGDGFKNVACYVSKYTCKGSFDNPAALQGFTAPMRVLTSKGFGDNLSKEEIEHYLALDKFDYNPEDVRGIPQKTLKDIVKTIVSRLYFTLPNVVRKSDGEAIKFALPQRLLKSIFSFRICRNVEEYPRYLGEGQYLYDYTPPKSGKSIWSAISYEVKSFIRNTHIQDSQREFETFVSNFPSKDIHKAVVVFEANRLAALSVREENKKQYLLKQLKYATE